MGPARAPAGRLNNPNLGKVGATRHDSDVSRLLSAGRTALLGRGWLTPAERPGVDVEGHDAAVTLDCCGAGAAPGPSTSPTTL
jgi:hypothetical protein